MARHATAFAKVVEKKEGVKVTPRLGIKYPQAIKGVTGGREFVARFIRRTYGTQRHALKLVAADAGVGIQTAKSWAAAKTEPNLSTFLRWAQDRPELRAEVARILALEAALDPRVPQLLNELVNLITRGTR